MKFHDTSSPTANLLAVALLFGNIAIYGATMAKIAGAMTPPDSTSVSRAVMVLN